ncbi:MAG TPA: OmpA family protein [Steroidobacteraceae bacterium]|jgi:outer membrane protein OmpA-like peptidoglycan-associated protein|nr:OmpA family protein [Steroidobacteraceae bacterium]
MAPRIAHGQVSRAQQRELDHAESLLHDWLMDLPPNSAVAILRADDHLTLRFSTSWVFEADGTALKADARRALPVSAALRLLKRRRMLGAQISVYTDSLGGESANQSFSAARAKALYDCFTAQGISAARLQQRGAGANDALASNGTPEGRIENRRVEIWFARAVK